MDASSIFRTWFAGEVVTLSDKLGADVKRSVRVSSRTTTSVVRLSLTLGRRRVQYLLRSRDYAHQIRPARRLASGNGSIPPSISERGASRIETCCHHLRTSLQSSIEQGLPFEIACIRRRCRILARSQTLTHPLMHPDRPRRPSLDTFLCVFVKTSSVCEASEGLGTTPRTGEEFSVLTEQKRGIPLPIIGEMKKQTPEVRSNGVEGEPSAPSWWETGCHGIRYELKRGQRAVGILHCGCA
ncbi:hypothetical protein C8Q80DRAFT_432491 [Daedaleopsis nitida]|nr:hypothetical protein C8Q80DRAFT_432491 [Daedaleopsis nitida]